MGLGPPVCTDCRVIADFDCGPPSRYYCPVCGKKNKDLGNLWEQKDHKIYETNTKFVRFTQGKKVR